MTRVFVHPGALCIVQPIVSKQWALKEGKHHFKFWDPLCWNVWKETFHIWFTDWPWHVQASWWLIAWKHLQVEFLDSFFLILGPRYILKRVKVGYCVMGVSCFWCACCQLLTEYWQFCSYLFAALLPAQRYASVVLAVIVCLSVCLSVCPSITRVLLRWLNLGSCKQHMQ